MRDQDNIQARLAEEERLLAATNENIAAAQRRIESLERQIESTRQQIQATENEISKLRGDTTTIQKRITLLSQYVEMLDAGDPGADLTPTSGDGAPAAGTDVTPTETAPELTGAIRDAPAADDELADDGGVVSAELPLLEEPDLDDEIGDVEFVSPTTLLPPGSKPILSEHPSSFDELDEEELTHEILPRTETFAEELLLVLAFHRKAVDPKTVVKIFRRLNYAPKLSATEKNVRALIESQNLHYEYAAGGKVALTREGRDEAHRLLLQLSDVDNP